MAILSLQRRLAEVGRIRLGHQIETRSGKKRPAALATFRLTSGDQARIQEAAKLYGGEVTKWESPNGLPAWEVITHANKLPVVVPPSAMAFSQHYELWSAGGCQRRCDGVTETLSEQACLCNPDSRQCEIHTRLSVMLRDLSGLGVWRVDTQGYYAAVELQGSVEIIGLAAGRGQMLPATLRLDPRSIKREGEGTKKFVVPVLDVDVSPAQLLMGGAALSGAAPPAIAYEPPAAVEQQRKLTPVPESEPAQSIADQVKASADQPSRRRATTIPSTGIAPRTAAQAQQARPADPWAVDPQNETQGTRTTSPAGIDRSDEARELAEQDAAREAAEQTQDQPRMSTSGQLQKLAILLTNRGFDSTKEGKAARLDFCSYSIRELLPDSPYVKREITSSKQLTFDEAHALIDMLETEEKQRPTPAESDANANTGLGEPVPAKPEADTREGTVNPDQMDLLGEPAQPS